MNPVNLPSELSALRSKQSELKFNLERTETEIKLLELDAEQRKTETERRKAKAEQLTIELVAVNKRIGEILSAQFKEQGLDKRITPYLPPGTSPN